MFKAIKNWLFGADLTESEKRSLFNAPQIEEWTERKPTFKKAVKKPVAKKTPATKAKTPSKKVVAKKVVKKAVRAK